MDNSSEPLLPTVSSQSISNSSEDDDSSTGRSTPKRAGRRKIAIEFIDDKSRRHITFSKRKAGIMKKAYELSTLTGTQVLLLVASETGHVYTFATPKLQPLITKPDGKNLIQACLNAPDTLQSHQVPPSHHNPGSNMNGSFSQSMNDNLSMNSVQNDFSSQQSPSHYNPNSNPNSNSSSNDDIKPYISRSSYGDVKPFQSSSPSPQDQYSNNMNPNNMNPNSPMNYSPYPQSNQTQMVSAGIRMPAPYNPSPGPSLPTLTDRGSFSNLPSQPIMPSYQYLPTQNYQPNHQFTNSDPSQQQQSNHFPSQTFPHSPQLFSKASNLPPLPRNDNL